MKLPLSAIQRILPNRIWQQIFLILVFLVVIPLVSLGILLIYTSQKAVKTTECTGDLQDKNQEFQSNIQMLADQSFVHCEELKDPLRSLLPTNLDRDQQIDWLADFIDQLVKKR